MPGRISSKPQAQRGLAEELGFKRCDAFWRDRAFVLATVAGVAFWTLLWWRLPIQTMRWRQMWSWEFLSLVVLQPCLEEVVFRGALQGRLSRRQGFRMAWRGFTVANGLTALLFAAGHLVSHPAIWAAGVVVPALAFGFFRDRYASIWPGMVLHMFYNGGYFILTGLPELSWTRGS